MVETGQLRVIVFEDGGRWVAQCLEHDIMAHAGDLDALSSRLCSAVMAEVNYSRERGVEPFAGIDPAPKHFHDMWDRRAGDFKPTMQRPPDVAVELKMALAA